MMVIMVHALHRGRLRRVANGIGTRQHEMPVPVNCLEKSKLYTEAKDVHYRLAAVGVSYVAGEFREPTPLACKKGRRACEGIVPAWIDRLSVAQYNTFEVYTRSHGVQGPYSYPLRYPLLRAVSVPAAQRAARPGPQYAVCGQVGNGTPDCLHAAWFALFELSRITEAFESYPPGTTYCNSS